MGGVAGVWSVFGPPSFKWVGVCTQSTLQSVFRQTDSWSNRLRRAVGSLASDLSSLGPLYSSLVNSTKFRIVLIVLGTGVQVGISALLTKQWQLIFQISQEPLGFYVQPCAQACVCVCVAVIECDEVCCESSGAPLGPAPLCMLL